MTSALSDLPRLGSGLSYRRSWDLLLRGASAAAWAEVIVERSRDLPEDDRALLTRLAGHVPVVAHGVAPAFDVPGDDDPDAVAAGAALAAEWNSPWFSGHLHPARGADSVHEWARAQGRRAQHLQDDLGVPFLLEVAEYDLPDVPEMATAVLEHCDCGLVLNLALLWQAVRERGVDPAGFLRRWPVERVVEVHLTTGDPRAGAVEEHTEPVAGGVWELFAELVAMSAVRASVVERDGSEPRDLAELNADLDHARQVFDDHEAPTMRT